MGDQDQDQPQDDTITDLPQDQPAEPAPGDTPPADTPADPDPDAPQDTPAEPAAPADEPPAYVKQIQDQVADLQEKLKARAEPQPAEPKPAEIKEPSPEFWEAQKAMLGFTKAKGDDGNEVVSLNEDKFIKGVFSLVREGVQQAMRYADQQVHGNVADMRFETTLARLEQKTPDIRKFSEDIRKFIDTRYKNPQDKSNPDIVMEAYDLVKGRAMRLGKLPAVPARPGGRVVPPAPAGSRGKPAAPSALTAQERAMVASEFGGDEKAYRAWRDMDPSKL